MGMFDTFIFLPEHGLKCRKGHELLEFQTKDLRCNMDTFAVAIDGRVTLAKSGWWNGETVDPDGLLKKNPLVEIYDAGCEECRLAKVPVESSWVEMELSIQDGHVVNMKWLVGPT